MPQENDCANPTKPEAPQKSNMEIWAENECRIREEKEGGANSYGGMCVESALKAFKSLLGDEHSGMSIMFTKEFLNRLIDGDCLTSLTGAEDEWGDFLSEKDSTQQNKRMTSVFRENHDNSTATWIYAVTITDDGGKNWFHGGAGWMIRRVCRKYEKVTFPFYPTFHYRVYCFRLFGTDFLVPYKIRKAK